VCQVVVDLLFTAHELISISKDGTVAFWELSSGECTRTLDVSSLNPGPNTRLHLSADGCRLIVDSDAINSPVYIFDMKTGQLLHKYVMLDLVLHNDTLLLLLMCHNHCCCLICLILIWPCIKHWLRSFSNLDRSRSIRAKRSAFLIKCDLLRCI